MQEPRLKDFIQIVLVSRQLCCIPLGSVVCSSDWHRVEPQPKAGMVNGNISSILLEEQPSCSNYLQLYSPLLCTSHGYLTLWGSNTKRLSNTNCHRCRRVRISGWMALYTVIGSHIRGGTGWRIKPVYPCGQRRVPSQDFSKGFA